MASSSRATTSSALSRRPSSYGVFINFRGEDTRHNFVRLLCDALKRDGIHAFIDSQELWEGEEILPSLLRAIRGSKISIPIFSQRYAESKYCLLELAQIWESHLSEGQTILPIFIGVEPRDVGHQEGSFKKPFEKYQTNCEPAIVEGWKNGLRKVGKIMGWTPKDETNCEPAIEPAIVEGWKNALKKVGKIKGWTLKGDATTTEQLNIVESVVQRAGRELHSSNPLDEEKHLIGIDSHVNELLHLLHYGSDDVRFVGICGMGGLGKTTIAKAMYNRIFRSFNGSSFLTDVREEASQGDKGLISLQKRLLHDIFTGDQVDISVVSKGSTLIAERLQREKVLIILDDVNDYKQLDALVGGFNWFGPGSKVIITTRNVHILNVHEKKVRQDIQIYMPRELDSKNSLLLFSLHAFSRNEPPEHYKQLSNEVVRYTGGLPLSLEVLGSFLIDKDKLEWEDTLQILKDIGNDNNVIGNLMEDYDYKVFQKLKISYDQLSDREKTIFLDVACYFNGWQKEKAISIWEACELHPRLTIKELIQKHLLKIDVSIYSDELVLKMHDQLQAMGRNIVLENSCQDLAKRSRLWSPDEIWRVLKEDTGTQMVEGILIQDDEFEAEDEFVSKDNEFEAKDVISCEAFQKMPNLRFLEFDGIGSLNGEFASLPSKLKWFRWKGMKILPPDFYHPQLVHLELSSCVTLQQSWNDPPQNKEKRFQKLKVLNVNFFVGLSLPPDFFLWFPCLQRLNLYQCVSLLEFPDSICRLASLKTINVDHCSPFRKLPDLSKLKGLRKLNIRSCENLEEIHGLTESLEELDVSFCSKLKELPDLSKMKRLRSLRVEYCVNIKKIHSLEGTEFLEELDTSFCSKLYELPDLSMLKGLRKLKLQSDKLKEIHGLKESLEELDASFCSKLKELPNLSKLKRLRKLNIRECENLEEIHGLEGIESLEELDASFCSKLKELPNLSKAKRLRKLNIRKCENLKEIHGLTESLEELDASFCSELKELPDLSKLKRLRKLNIKECETLGEIHGLEGTESLEELDAFFCYNLKELPDLSKLKRLRKLKLQNCKNLEEIHGLTESLEELDVASCSELKELSDLSKLKRLRSLNIESCEHIEKIHGLEGIESLEELDMSFCSSLKAFPDLSKLKGLRKLKLQRIYNLEKIHGLTESLEELDASFCSKLKEFPDLSKPKRLRKLNIEKCKNLKEIHVLKGTKSLEELDARFCSELKELPDLSKVKRLRKLNIQKCIKRDEIRSHTKSLEELDVASCSELKELSYLSKLKRVRSLNIESFEHIEKIHGLEGIESLEELDMSFCSSLKELPDLPKLKGLRKQKLQRSYNLEKIHGLPESLEELDASFCYNLKELPDLSKLKRLRKLKLQNCENLEEIHGLTESLEKLDMRGCFKITETTRKILGQGKLVDRDVGQMQGLNGSPILCVVFAFKPQGVTEWQGSKLETISLEIDAFIRQGKFWTRCLHSIRIEDIKCTTQDIIYIHYFKGFDWFGFRLESKGDISKLNASIYGSYYGICYVKLVKVLFENKESNRHRPNQQSSAMLVAEFFKWSEADDAEEVKQKGACLDEEDEDDEDEEDEDDEDEEDEDEEDEDDEEEDEDDEDEEDEDEEDEDDEDEDQGRLHQPSHVQENGKTPFEVKLNNRFNLQERPIQQPNIDNEVQGIPSDIEEAERNNLFSSSYDGVGESNNVPEERIEEEDETKAGVQFLCRTVKAVWDCFFNCFTTGFM